MTAPQILAGLDKDLRDELMPLFRRPDRGLYYLETKDPVATYKVIMLRRARRIQKARDDVSS